MKCLQALDELELENELTQKEAESRSNEEKERMEEKKNLVDEMTAQYFEFKKGVAKQAVNSRYMSYKDITIPGVKFLYFDDQQHSQN